MGKILNIKSINDEKVQVTLEMSSKEAKWLQGNMEKMHLFSENNLVSETRLVQRGRRESTRYILLPKEFRKDAVPSNNIKCTAIDTKTHTLMIFSARKF